MDQVCRDSENNYKMAWNWNFKFERSPVICSEPTPRSPTVCSAPLRYLKKKKTDRVLTMLAFFEFVHGDPHERHYRVRSFGGGWEPSTVIKSLKMLAHLIAVSLVAGLCSAMVSAPPTRWQRVTCNTTQVTYTPDIFSFTLFNLYSTPLFMQSKPPSISGAESTLPHCSSCTELYDGTVPSGSFHAGKIGY